MEEKGQQLGADHNIFPLSPDPSLGEDSTRVYFRFLKDALEGSEKNRIHNIAITGGFGTGKSSLIRSYDTYQLKLKTDANRTWATHFNDTQPRTDDPTKDEADTTHNNTEYNGKFLYISVGEYTSNGEAEIKQTGAGQSEEKPAQGDGTSEEKPAHGEDTTTISAIERRMLLQIFARFRRADLPQSSFRLIPETWTRNLRWTAFLIGVFVFCVLLLCFHEPLGKLLVAVNSMIVGHKLFARIIAFLVKNKTLLRLLLYAYCIGFGAVVSMFLCIRILPRIRFHMFSVKGANAEFSLERETAESYLDLYSMELVYCLEKLAEKIDYVVVFEDLDRLDPKDCLYIITRLREINNLVNLRLQRNHERLCFIYAVNDDFLGRVQHEKLFDYILPVIPEMNSRSAAVLFAEKINSIDEKYDVLKVFPQFETAASCLSDYRLQNTILNEYQVLKELYTTTKTTVQATGTQAQANLNDSHKNEILAFAIYKNFWPTDYHALRENNSQIFTIEGVKRPPHLMSTKYGKLLEVLTDPNNHLLTLHSLFYVNFDENKLADMYYKHWEDAIKDPARHKEICAELDTIQEDQWECLEKAKEFFMNLKHLIIYGEKEPYYCMDLFRAMVKCMVRCNQSDNLWFFDTKSKLLDCLKLLAKMENEEELKVSFFVKSFQSQKTDDFYSTSPDDLNKTDISVPELRELCRGKKDVSKLNFSVSESTQGKETEIKLIRDEFKAKGSTPYFQF